MVKSVGIFWNQLLNRIPTAYRSAAIAAIPVLAICPAIASWTWSREAKNNAIWWVNHTQEVIGESNGLVKVLVDAETGIRGYTITRKSEFLKPYDRGKEQTPIHLNKLKQLTQDNSSQQQQLITIERQITTRLNTLELVLARLESVNQPINNELFIQGKTEMDLVRNSIEVFREEEWRLLNLRQKKLDRIKYLTNVLLGVSVLISLFGYGLAVALYRKSQQKLQQQIVKLDLTNSELAQSNQLIKKRNQELDSFTYIVSHDLKAPLRAINNLSEWIEEDLGDKLDEDISHNMRLLRGRVQRMIQKLIMSN